MAFAGPLLAAVLFDLDIRLPYLVGAVAMVVAFVVSLGWVVQAHVPAIEANA